MKHQFTTYFHRKFFKNSGEESVVEDISPSAPTIKCLFVIQDFHLPSSRVRVLNLLPELAKHGIEANTIPFPKKLSQQIKLFNYCREMDVTILQKRLLSLFNITLISKLSRKLAFDFDDAIYIKQHQGKISTNKGRFKKFAKTISVADKVIVGNHILAEIASNNPNISIIPSAVETRNIAVKDYTAQNPKTIIGWIGTPVNLPYLTLLQPQLARLAKQCNFEFHIISSEPVELPGVDIQFIPWSLESQEAKIAQFDIGVMPLPDSEHAAGKCGYKALQYMAAAVPAVVSDVGVNHEIVIHGKEGMVCEKIEDFHDALKYLIEHPETRQKMGIAARAKIKSKYSIEVVGKQLADTLHSLSQQP